MNSIRPLYLPAAVCILFMTLYFLWGGLAPFIYGLIIAYILDPITERLNSWGVHRAFAALVPPVLFVLLLVILALFFVPSLIEATSYLKTNLPMYKQSVEQYLQQAEWLNQLSGAMGGDFSLHGKVSQLAQQALPIIPDSLSVLASSANTFIKTLSFMVLMPLVMYYSILCWPHVSFVLREITPKPYREGTLKLFQELDAALAAFLRGQMCIVAILGVLYGIGLWIAGIPYGFIIGLCMGFLNFIPLLGTILGALLAFIVTGLHIQLTGWEPYAIVGATFALGQFLENFILTPKLVGESVGLHPLWVLLALFAAGEWFGLVGILLALPVATLLSVIMPKLYRLWLASNFHAKGF